MHGVLYELIEAFILPCCLSVIFTLKDYKKYIAKCFVCSSFVLVLNYINNSHLFWLPIMLIFVYVHLLEEQKEMIKIDYSLLAIVLYFIAISSELFVMFIVKVMNIQQLIVETFFKSLLLVLIFYTIIKNKKIKRFSLSIFEWHSIIFIELILFAILLVVKQYIETDLHNNFNLYILAFFVIVLNILFMVVIIKTNKLHEKNIQLITHQQNVQFNDEKLKLIRSIKSEIDAIDHRMFYIIFKIDYLLKNNEIDKIKSIVDKYKEIITKHNMIIDTSNAVFDCLLSLKINDLVSNDVIVKTCVFVSKSEFYENLSFINFVTSILDFFSESEEVQLFINEEPGACLIKVIYTDCNKIIDMKEYLKQRITKFNGKYKLEENNRILKIIVRS